MLKKKLFPETETEDREWKRLRNNYCQTSRTNENTSAEGSDESDMSKYFSRNLIKQEISFADRFLNIQLRLNESLKPLNYLIGPIKYVYNPVEYAYCVNENYVRRYCNSQKKLVFVGMNPGPNGMCQTGVPFGDVNWVKNWLLLDGEIKKPSVECPKKPVLGFSNINKEPSGDRFWKFFSELCGDPDKFFKNSFVYNYCPLAFLDQEGRNITPADIKDIQLRDNLESICNVHFLHIIELLNPEIIIAVGAYIEKQVKNLFKKQQINHFKLIRLAHPSPRAVNNNNWPEKAQHFLESNNLLPYFLDSENARGTK